MINPEIFKHVPEVIQVIGTLGFLMAFTKKQRDAIAFGRDGGHCQATVRHRCNESQGLEVDHIIPQRYGAQMGLDEDTLDQPENALTKCKNSHNLKHPDRVGALQHYHEAKAEGINTFSLLFQERAAKLQHRQIYWNPDNDRTDTVRALQLTQKAKKKGWVFPSRH